MNGERMKSAECKPQSLAIAIMPIQPKNSKLYDPADSLAQGTLFPSLNLPFYLAVHGTPVPITPLTEIQALDFVLVELNLYLDTHPMDEEAYALFRKYNALSQKARKLYEEKYGPLTAKTPTQQDNYTWIHGPWPWEKEAN